MATYAIGDVHGNRDALADLLDQLAGEIVAGDEVVFLGDYIDRGSATKACVDLILAFREATPAGVIALCGNHDDWMLRSRYDPTVHTWLLATDARCHTTCSSMRCRPIICGSSKS